MVWLSAGIRAEASMTLKNIFLSCVDRQLNVCYGFGDINLLCQQPPKLTSSTEEAVLCKRRDYQMNADTICSYCISKRMTRGINIYRARLTVCEVVYFEREIS